MITLLTWLESWVEYLYLHHLGQILHLLEIESSITLPTRSESRGRIFISPPSRTDSPSIKDKILSHSLDSDRVMKWVFISPLSGTDSLVVWDRIFDHSLDSVKIVGQVFISPLSGMDSPSVRDRIFGHSPNSNRVMEWVFISPPFGMDSLAVWDRISSHSLNANGRRWNLHCSFWQEFFQV